MAAPAASQPATGPGVFGFGNNDDGQLGNGTVTTRTLGPVSGLPASVKQIAAGGSTSAALLPDGTVWTWGDNEYGLLGNGTTNFPASTPQQVPGLTGITQIAVAVLGEDAFAVGSGGSVWAWGRNLHGQLGNGTTVNRYSPAPVPGLTGITQVSAGPGYTLALRSDGTVWAWGENDGGQLGDGTKTDHLVPEQVPGLSGITQVLASGVSFAVRSDGTVLDWGFGYLGNGAEPAPPSRPKPVPGLTGITQVASDGGHTLALRSDGTVWAWGLEQGRRGRRRNHEPQAQPGAALAFGHHPGRRGHGDKRRNTLRRHPADLGRQPEGRTGHQHLLSLGQPDADAGRRPDLGYPGVVRRHVRPRARHRAARVCRRAQPDR